MNKHILIAFFVSLFLMQQVPTELTKLNVLKNNKRQKVFVIFDYGCSFCEKTLLFHLDKLAIDERAMILYTKQKKVQLANTIYQGHLKKENFTLSNSEELFSLITKKTNDFKGPFVLEIENNKIINIQTLNESN